MGAFLFPTIKSLGSIPGVAAGARLTAKIPTTGKKYGFFLRGKTAGGVDLTAAQLNADVGDIIIRVNGEPKIEASCTELLMIQQYFGAAFVGNNVSGIIPIWLYPPDLATWDERKALGWGMNGVQSVTMEVSILGVAQLSTLELWELSSDEDEVMGTHLMIRRFPHTFAATGDQDISDLVNNQPDMAYKCVFIQKPGTSTITKVTCKVNNQLVYDQVPEPLNNVINQYGEHQVQAGYYCLDFAKIEDLRGMLPMKNITDYRQTITWATAAPNNYQMIAILYKGLK